MSRWRALTTDERAFTLVEVMVTIFILLVGMAGALTLITGASATTLATQQRQAATSLARELVESARSVPYGQLSTASVATELQARAAFVDSVAGDSTWTVLRDQTTYTLTAAVCSEDDARDGIGSHAVGTFCASTATSANPDSAPDDYKRVTVTVRWRDAQAVRSIEQAAVVGNPSSASGPAITDYTATPAPEVYTEPTLASVRLNVTTDVRAATIRWAVDGEIQGRYAPTGTASTFDWPVASLVDGTYVVSATAFDAQDGAGASRFYTMKLNRRPPAAPSPLTGGWNATRSAVDLDWRANLESDIVEYRVFRGAETTPVCSTGPTVTSCHDPAPPAGATIDYTVKAVDRDPSTRAENPGAASAPLTTTRTTNAPTAPGALTAAPSSGSVALSWTASSAPYGQVAFYRIYRDGQAVANRYDRTANGTDLTYMDTDLGGAAHTYSVSAVDVAYSESALTGPVSP